MNTAFQSGPIEAIDASWQELLTLSKNQAQYNFGVPKLLESELNLIEIRIESAKGSGDVKRLEQCLSDTQQLVKRLRTLLQQA